MSAFSFEWNQKNRVWVRENLFKHLSNKSNNSTVSLLFHRNSMNELIIFFVPKTGGLLIWKNLLFLRITWKSEFLVLIRFKTKWKRKGKHSTYFDEHSTYPHRQCFRTSVEISFSSCQNTQSKHYYKCNNFKVHAKQKKRKFFVAVSDEVLKVHLDNRFARGTSTVLL